MNIYKIKSIPSKLKNPFVEYIEIDYISNEIFLKKVTEAYTKKNNAIKFYLYLNKVKFIQIQVNTYLDLLNNSIRKIEFLKKSYNDCVICKLITFANELILLDYKNHYDGELLTNNMFDIDYNIL